MKPTRLSPNEMRVICTGRGAHASLELALLVANRGDPEPAPSVDLTWLAKSAPAPSVARGAEESGSLADLRRVLGDTAPLLPADTAAVRAAAVRPRSRRPKGEIVKHVRADGGVTIEFPPCPKCKVQARRVRSHKLDAYMRAAPGQPFDLSLIP